LFFKFQSTVPNFSTKENKQDWWTKLAHQ
jgi:hypothetical protein